MWGQVVIGPPGSGKSTYCAGMSEFLDGLKRPTVVVNLDPANDEKNVPYKKYMKVDLRDLVCLEKVMKEFSLGPNGGMIYCMEFLEKNIDWLITKLEKIGVMDHYFLFDLPGQIELFTSHKCVRNVLKTIEKKFGFKLTVVNLIDSTYCLDIHKYISSVIVSLSMMIYLEFPHVNILSKIDLLDNNESGRCGKLMFDLDYFTEVQNLKHLINMSNSKDSETTKKRNKKYDGINKALVNVIEDYDNVCFKALNIQDKDSVYSVLKVVDKANGYIFGYLEKDQMLNIATDEDFFS